MNYVYWFTVTYWFHCFNDYTDPRHDLLFVMCNVLSVNNRENGCILIVWHLPSLPFISHCSFPISICLKMVTLLLSIYTWMAKPLQIDHLGSYLLSILSSSIWYNKESIVLTIYRLLTLATFTNLEFEFWEGKRKCGSWVSFNGTWS